MLTRNGWSTVSSIFFSIVIFYNWPCSIIRSLRMHFIAYISWVSLCSTRNTLPKVPSPILFFISKSLNLASTFFFFLNIDSLYILIEARSLLISGFASKRWSKFWLTSSVVKSYSSFWGYSCLILGYLEGSTFYGDEFSGQLRGSFYYSRISSIWDLLGASVTNVIESAFFSCWSLDWLEAYANWRCYSAIDTNPGVGPPGVFPCPTAVY